MSAVKVALQHSQKSERRKGTETMSAEVSPDSKCPICLDIFHNISYLDRCLHKFCFRCIVEWSKNKAECPLCKQPFSSIYHTIKSEQDFQKYELKQRVEHSSFGYFEGVRFRYRTTLTGVHRQMRGRTSPPPDNGVMFETSTNPPVQRQDRYIRRMTVRLAARRRAESEGRPVSSVGEQEMVNFRRELYRRGIKVRSVRDGGRSRDISAEFYRRNPACLHRLVPWLKRELTVLYGAHGSLVNIVQHIIMSRITRYDMEDGAIQEELRPFLQARTEHFLHEFISFAKSPFNTEAYDQHAVYDCPAPSSNEDSNSNSSVIAISEDEEKTDEREQPGGSASSLSHSLWDDETPGPSYSTTANPSRVTHLSVHNSDSDSTSEEESQELQTPAQAVSPHHHVEMTDCINEECASSDSDDCVIVGFVKATVERTPELVQLSSDSDESSSDDGKDEPPQAKHIRFNSCSPAASPGSKCSTSERAEKEKSLPRHDSKDKSNSSESTHKRSEKSHDKEKRRCESRERLRERNKSKDRRRRTGRSRSAESRLQSRSPVISHSSCPSTEGSYSHVGKELSKYDRSYKSKSKNDYRSYSHYRHEKYDGATTYAHELSHYHSNHKYRDKYVRSHSRSPSRDSRRQDKRHQRRSRSRTYSSSCSPSERRRSYDKPGGKRKYKTRHLEEPSSEIHRVGHDGDSTAATHSRKSKEKHRKKSKERPGKNSSSGGAELAVDEKGHHQRKHHKKKKKHKKRSKRHKSSECQVECPLTVITIDSESDSHGNDNAAPVYSAQEHYDSVD